MTTTTRFFSDTVEVGPRGAAVGKTVSGSIEVMFAGIRNVG